MKSTKKLLIIILSIVVLLIIFFSVYFLFFKPLKNSSNADNSLLEIKKKGKIVVGTEIPYNPMEFYDENGQLTGFDVEMMKEIARRMEVEVEFKKYEWDFLLNAAKNNEVDLVVSGVTISAERSKEMLFSIPYLNSGTVLMTKIDNNKIRSLLDLKDRKIGMEAETSGYYEIQKYTDIKNIVSYKNNDELLKALRANEIEALVMDYIVAADLAHKNKDIKIVDFPFAQEFCGIVTALKNVSLIEEINRILRDLKREEFLKNLETKWFR